jgi:uncharacterized protein YdeI (YjbR/CyaY-like superfamily)
LARDVELDTEPRDVSVPPDFGAALDAEADARERFDGLSYSQRLRHVLAIEQAKTPEPRAAHRRSGRVAAARGPASG